MYIDLYKFVENDENCEEGEYLGSISLEQDDIFIDMDNDVMAEKMEEVFSEPLKVSNGPLGEEEVEPYTKNFFRRIIKVLPEYNIRGKLKEDEDTESFKILSNSGHDEIEEEEEDLPIEEQIEEIDEIEQDFELDESEIESELYSRDEEDYY